MRDVSQCIVWDFQARALHVNHPRYLSTFNRLAVRDDPDLALWSVRSSLDGKIYYSRQCSYYNSPNNCFSSPAPTASDISMYASYRFLFRLTAHFPTATQINIPDPRGHNLLITQYAILLTQLLRNTCVYFCSSIKVEQLSTTCSYLQFHWSSSHTRLSRAHEPPLRQIVIPSKPQASFESSSDHSTVNSLQH